MAGAVVPDPSRPSASLVPSSRAICVLGFGRSGTSMTMRALNLLGVDVGPQAALLPPHAAHNPKGYWEPRWLVDLNDAILERLDGTWWDPPAAVDWSDQVELEPLRQRARTGLEEHYGGAHLWGWKDPRTTLTLPFWQELIPRLEFVICVRNPSDAIASFEERPWHHQDREQWGALWLEYTARALTATRGRPRLVTYYEDWFDEPEREVARLAQFVDGPRTPRADRSLADVVSSINSDMRHHETSLEELSADDRLPVEARAGFILLRSSRAGRPNGIPNAIESVLTELSRHCQARLRTASDQERVRHKLASEVRAMRSSWSWRTTAPLRAIGRLLRFKARSD